MKNFSRFGINVKEVPLERTVIYETACIYSLIEKRISDYFRPFNLSPVKFNTLMVIKHQGKDMGLSQVDISKHLIVSASNMTRLLDRMSKEGLIERFSQEGDRRVNLVKITKRGTDLLAKVWPGYCSQLSEVGNLLNKNELKQAKGILDKWSDKLEAGQ